MRGTKCTYIRIWNKKIISNQYIENDVLETFVLEPNIVFFYQIDREKHLFSEGPKTWETNIKSQNT